MLSFVCLDGVTMSGVGECVSGSLGCMWEVLECFDVCLYEGAWYSIGAILLDGDDCEECSCMISGEVVCIDQVCPECEGG